jgi:aminopeptidase N
VSAYLTSVVIGNFSHNKKDYNSVQNEHNDVPLHYYWPKDIEDLGYDAMLTFGDTPDVMKIFKEYFGIEYPFEKYSQVAVDDFEFGGMENASCTTLTRNILHDKRASLDYTFDIFVVAHELAHQWFGDLVTCKEWSHIWLNEGFATFCEALYWEKYGKIETETENMMNSIIKFYKQQIAILVKLRANTNDQLQQISIKTQGNYLMTIHIERVDAYYICLDITLLMRNLKKH